MTSGSATLKDAINDALRDWVATVRETHYCIGSVVGPAPVPVDGARVPAHRRRRGARAVPRDPRRRRPRSRRRVRRWRLQRDGHLRRLRRHRRRAHRRRGGRARHRVRPPRRLGRARHARRAARRALALPAGRGRPDPRGPLDQRRPRLSRASGPSTPRSPRTGRAEYQSATDAEALEGFQLLAATEGIVPALEPAHAIGWLAREVGHRVPRGRHGARHAVGPGRQGRQPGGRDAHRRGAA